jgi:hypothetical protein
MCLPAIALASTGQAGCCFTGGSVLAQNDSSHYVSYEDQLTTRFYFSKKYTSFRFLDQADDIRLRYFPNTTLNMGVGATYKWASLNLGFGFGFLNPDDGKGDTKYVDLQGDFYGRTFLIDVLGQFYKGFYLIDEDLRDANGDFYTRPDIRLNVFGLSGQYIFNHERFSYRAGFLQNEWQKKSAGTMLLGWQLSWGNGEADSTIVPYAISNVHQEAQKQRLSFFQTGPSIGYAYTAVLHEHFFIMGSGAIALVFGTNLIAGPERERSSSFLPNFSFKTFAGYNSEKWAISLTFTNETLNIGNNLADQRFALSAGNLRLNFVRRFVLKRDLIEAIRSKTGLGR